MAIYMDPEMMDKMNKLKAVSEEDIMRKLNRRLPGGSSHIIQQRMKAEAARAAGGSDGQGTSTVQSKPDVVVKTSLKEGLKQKAEVGQKIGF